MTGARRCSPQRSHSDWTACWSADASSSGVAAPSACWFPEEPEGSAPSLECARLRSGTALSTAWDQLLQACSCVRLNPAPDFCLTVLLNRDRIKLCHKMLTVTNATFCQCGEQVPPQQQHSISKTPHSSLCEQAYLLIGTRDLTSQCTIMA